MALQSGHAAFLLLLLFFVGVGGEIVSTVSDAPRQKKHTCVCVGRRRKRERGWMLVRKVAIKRDEEEEEEETCLLATLPKKTATITSSIHCMTSAQETWPIKQTVPAFLSFKHPLKNDNVIDLRLKPRLREQKVS